MKYSIYQVDAFTDKLFGGNPAAVCPMDHWPATETMQLIAAENNLAETAFFIPDGDGFHLRWFTPKLEMDLCGHATLASAHVLFNHLGFEGDLIRFQSRSGELTVARSGDLLTLDFPASTYEPVAEIPPALSEALGAAPTALYKSRDLLALFDKETDITALQPDFRALLGALESMDCLGLIATAPGDSVDFVSRFFAPPAGIDEDPVTGSAHTMLIPFWADRLDKAKLHAFQLSERKGELFCELNGDRVMIGGKAVTYLTGKIEGIG